MELAGLLVLQLVDAAFAAAVAQGLPLRAVELFERQVFPEFSAHRTQCFELLGDRRASFSIGSDVIGLPFGSIR
jgi:hypothetical protein